jgi:nucleoid-associated protein YgaU
MRKSIGILIGACALLVLGAASLGAQSLLDNEFYKKAMQQQQQSEQAYQNGDYDTAAALAKEAKDNFQKSDAWVEQKMNFYRANGWLQRATERLSFAKNILKADVNYKKEFGEASDDVSNAKTQLDAEDYPQSIHFSQAAIDALKDVKGIAAAPKPATAEEPPLPATYTVRLNMEKRDCFWRIAGFPFVYNDPWKWKTLYEANKNIIGDPNNPDLIEPGQVFTIPSLQGETREGDYDPAKTYTPLSPK